MIQNLNLGPPLQGLPNLKTLGRDSKDARSDSFGKELRQKMNSDEAALPKTAQRPDTAALKVKTERIQSKPEEDDRLERKDPELPAEVGKPEKKMTQRNNREKAIKKFMDSFESEFEIPPTRLVEAIAKLDQSEQLKSPEETSDAVLAQLGLDEKDQDRARALYAALLVDLNKAPAAAPTALKPMLAEPPSSLASAVRERIQATSQQRDLLNLGVDDLNQKFWMKSDQQVLDSSDFGGDFDLDPSQNLNQELAFADGNSMDIPPHLKGQLAEKASPAMMAALAAQMAKTKANSSQKGEASTEAVETDTAEAGGAGLVKGSSSAFKNPNVSALTPPSAGDGGGSESGGFGQNGSQESFAKKMSVQKEGLKAEGKILQRADFKEALSKGLQTSLPGAGLALPKETLTTATVAAGATTAAMANMTPAEHETNVRQLMNQAQYLIKKGGGEVNVQMSPEGMGPVHLKVILQDGKVNVQMSAASDETKKALESSLADLKTSLAAHKLSVDHVKVDVVSGASTDTATNNQTNLNSNGQRENAKQFWNQFNENFGSQAQREALYDVTNTKGYRQPKKDPLQPIETAQARSRTAEGKGSGLNLVA